MWPHSSNPRSDGRLASRVQRFTALALVTFVCALAPAGAADERPVKIVVLGDSLSAGFGLSADAAFPARLAQALTSKGIAASVANAGVSGDTASGGLGRLDWSVPEGTEAVIVELMFTCTRTAV